MKSKKHDRKKYVTTDEACELLNVHRSTLYRYKIQTVNTRGRTYWLKSDIEKHRVWN